MTEQWVDEVHRFWFEEIVPEAWFRKDTATDAAIRVRFLPLHRRLSVAPPLPGDPQTVLAAVIVFDQFSRNMFRGTADSFASDAKALALAKATVAAGLDNALTTPERQFLYMPFEHSEDAAMQQRSLDLFAALGVPDLLDYAQRHKAIVDRFGRFPHRNAILGRTSTPQELEFVKTTPPF